MDRLRSVRSDLEPADSASVAARDWGRPADMGAVHNHTHLEACVLSARECLLKNGLGNGQQRLSAEQHDLARPARPGRSDIPERHGWVCHLARYHHTGHLTKGSALEAESARGIARMSGKDRQLQGSARGELLTGSVNLGERCLLLLQGGPLSRTDLH